MVDQVRGPAEALAVAGVSAGYGGRAVVRQIDLHVGRGDIVGLLGANGSGKSTLLRAVTGQIRLLSGHVLIEGADVARTPEVAKASLGFAVDAADLPAALSGRQYLELVASIRRCAADNSPCGDVISRLGLGRWLDRPIGEYSLGTRGKISIAAALLGAPSLLIFDETLNGLDPVAAWEVKQMIAELSSSGRHAIVLSTHVVETVPSVCNRAVFLADGQIVESWNAEELREASRNPGDFEAAVMAALRAHWIDREAA